MNKFEIETVRSQKNELINYSYIVINRSSRTCAIIDPSWDMEGIDIILKRLNVQPSTVLLTHSHEDHVNLVHECVRRYNTEVYMSSREIEYYGYHCPNLNRVENMQELQIGNGKVICIETPGHSHGSMCFLVDDEFMFTGDTLFIEGCGTCTTEGADPKELYLSLQKIKSLLHGSVMIYPGHSFGKAPGFTFSYLLKNNIYLQLDNMELFVQFRMRKNQPMSYTYY
ncbi:hypothetical protein PSTEL_06135 [Paenibacillus stellifer]|uniref:Metallo-beta-lactamase domain-containing protein n=1 Tax=Paenibacillus stellifer TaxID=169760 RepID=A0A089LU38_9BACL|nr:MBL fold metallo-hydrolase [Paenibacillus stellifer]AIQ62743.1 hypothetical protein PSTEL_06135 [Paenibacillus stellifer]